MFGEEDALLTAEAKGDREEEAIAPKANVTSRS